MSWCERVRGSLPFLVVVVWLSGAAVCFAQHDRGMHLWQWRKAQLLPKEGRIQDITIWDFDQDGLFDLLVTHNETKDVERPQRFFSYYRQSPALGFPPKPQQRWQAPAELASWSMADVDGQKGVDLVLLTRDGLFYWPMARKENRFDLEARRLLYAPTFFEFGAGDDLPRWQVPPRDLSGNGLHDLLVPCVDHYRVYFQTRAGVFGRAPRLRPGSNRSVLPYKRYEHQLGVRDFLVLESRLPEPWICDFNGDQLSDLLFFDEGEFSWFLQQSGPDFLPAPSGKQTLAFFRKVVADNTLEFPQISLCELNGDGHADMVVSLNKGEIGVFESLRTELQLYFGRPSGPYPDKPDQVINLEGVSVNPVFFDLNGDGAQDMLCSALSTSLIDQMGKLIFGGIEVDYYIYLYQPSHPPHAGRYKDEPELHHSIRMDAGDVEASKSIPLFHLDKDFTGDGLPDGFKVTYSHGEYRLLILEGEEKRVFLTGKTRFDIDEDGPYLRTRLGEDRPHHIHFWDLNRDGREDFILQHGAWFLVFLSRR